MIPNYTDYLQWVQQQNMMQAQPVPQNNQPMVAFVANKTAADLFNVNPGQEAVLIDMDMPYVYRKARSADNKLQPLGWYDLVPHKEVEVVKEEELNEKYVKREDLDKIIADEVEKRMSEVFTKYRKKGADE